MVNPTKEIGFLLVKNYKIWVPLTTNDSIESPVPHFHDLLSIPNATDDEVNVEEDEVHRSGGNHVPSISVQATHPRQPSQLYALRPRQLHLFIKEDSLRYNALWVENI